MKDQELPATLEVELGQENAAVPNTFGKKLQEARKRCSPKKNQTAISKETGVTLQTVSLWETGDSYPPRDRIEAIARAYHVPLAECTKWYDDSQTTEVVGNAGAGYKYIAEVLDSYAKQARDNRQSDRWVIHSISNRGFLTSDQPLIGEAVCKCAAAGVDIVYIALPGRAPPQDVINGLRERLQKKIERTFANTQDQEAAAKHIWLAFPEKPTDDHDPRSMSGKILGIFCRIITVIRTAPLPEGHTDDIASTDLYPIRDVERFWIDLDMANPDTKVIGPWWIPISGGGTNLSEAYLEEMEICRQKLKTEPLKNEQVSAAKRRGSAKDK